MEYEGDQSQLCFGSILAIADFKDQDAYIFSDGFLKTDVILKNFVHKPKTGDKGIDSLKNNSFYNCLFQVLPKVSDTTKAQKLKTINSKQNDIKKKPNHQQSILNLETVQNQEQELEQRYFYGDIKEDLMQLLNEYKYNLDTVDKSKNTKITYNYPFQLMHLASNRFLACHEVESRHENQNYQVKLDDFTSDATVFTIVPAFRYQKDGEQVQIQSLYKDVNAGEMCAITRLNPISNKPTYIHCSANEISDIKGGKSSMASSDNHVYKREVNASVEYPHSWKVVLFQHYIPDNIRFLRVGDCLWLHHSESECVLGVQRKVLAVDKFSFTSIDLTQWLNLDNLEVNAFSAHGGESSDSFSGITSGLWQIEGSEFWQGGYVQFEKAYRLRNLSTGYYLAVVSENQGHHSKRQKSKNHMQFSLTSNSTDKSTLFEFVELKTLTSDKYAKSGSYIYLKNVANRVWVDFTETEIDGEYSYRPTLKPEKERTEHAVFKIQVPTRNNVWEINFLLSCFRMLAKFLIFIQQPKFPGVKNLKEKKSLIPRFKQVRRCIQDLNDFVCNMQYNTSIEQVYGSINPQRQKLLREQFYVDILIKILNRIITKGELELWQKRATIIPKKKNDESRMLFNQSDDSQQEDEEFTNVDPLNNLMIDYVGWKIELCKSIYKFLGSMCKLNAENQIYTFELIPYFQLQTKYIPQSIYTIIDIVSSNKKLLYKLSEGLRIEYDFQNQKDTIDENNDKVKILINLYENEEEDIKAQLSDRIQFKQHEKITSKPINLIVYFVNLIWDDEAINNSDYLAFLSSVCRYHNEAISINQENIFKLYKKYNDNKPKLGVETKAEEMKQNDGTVRLMSKAGQLVIPAKCEPGQKTFKYIIEQLTFFSEVAFGRNYLWKKELGAQFEKSFLFRNIWNEKPMDQRYESLKPCFAKIAQTLYIHQEPLIEKTPPILCRLFSDCDEAEDYNLFKSSVDGQKNLQELKTYSDLIDSLIRYFESLDEKLQLELGIDGSDQPPAQKEQKDTKQHVIGEDFLKEELIDISTKLIFQVLRLELFQVLESSLDKPEKYCQKNYSTLINILLQIFQYDKFEIRFVRAHSQTYKNHITEAKKEKESKAQLIGIGNMKMFKQKEKKIEDDEVEEPRVEAQASNEQTLFTNPLMRGYIKFYNKLQSFNHLDSKYFENEVQVKMNICDILERFLDMRQNHLVQNALIFFKRRIVMCIDEQEEFNDKIMSKILKKETKGKKTVHDLTMEDRIKRMIERIVGKNQLGLLPNIARTGIKEIDEPKIKEEVNFMAQLKKLQNLKLFQQEEITHQKNYIEAEGIAGIPEILDFDQYLSFAMNDPDPMKKPIASMLPTLLNTFMIIQDSRLEKRCIGVIMRLFNQQEEFKHNLRALQVIFDDEKTILFRYCATHLDTLQKNVERIEIWFTNLANGYPKEDQQLDECIDIIHGLNVGMQTGIHLKDNELLSASSEICSDKQNLLANLQAQKWVIAFIREGMNYFHDIILDPDFQLPLKEKMIVGFQKAFQFLKDFCYLNNKNQLTLFEDMQCFTSYLQYDLGQIDLMIEIYRNNKYLLVHKIDSSIIQLFTNLIEREGRQEQFLFFYEQLIIYHSKYLFDNQLAVLNNLLPSEIKDQTIKILYADNMKENEIKFYLDDIVYAERDTFLDRMIQVDFKDTFRDEPFRYHAKLIDLLIQTTLVDVEKRRYKPRIPEEDQKQNFNISVAKLKRYFKADYILDLLKQFFCFISRENDNFVRDYQRGGRDDEQKRQIQASLFNEDKANGFNILKPRLIELLRLVHISSERGSVQNSELFHQQGKVAQLFDFESKRLDIITRSQDMNRQLLDYYYEGIIPFTVAYYQRYLKRLQESAEEDRKDSNSIDKWVKQLFGKLQTLSSDPNTFISSQEEKEILKELYDCIIDNKHSKVKPDHSLITFKSFLDVAFEKQFSLLEQDEIVPDVDVVSEEENLLGSNSLKYNRFQKRKVQPVAVKESITPPKDSDSISKLWTQFLDELVGNKTYQERQEKEQETIAQALLSIKKLLNPANSKNVNIRPDVKMVSKKLILFLQSGFNDPSCKGTVDTLLKILKKIIQSSKSKRNEMQTLFDSLGATQMVLLVLSETTQFIDKPMMMSFLVFMNCLLEGGNSVVQKTIYNFMMQFTQSEMIFSKINQIIRKQIENVEVINKSKMRSEESMLSIEDSEVKEDLDLVNQILQFLQNSVEGHYLDLQNYHRKQSNSRNNYDLVLSVTELFKTYYYEGFVQDNYDNMTRCLDTLNELVQGPCPENQIAVSESKFFDIASDIFTKKNPGQQKQKIDEFDFSNGKNVTLTKWMIARLQNKVLNLVLSLLESREINENNQVLKRIMRNLPLTLLERHLAKAYDKYERIYGKHYVIDCLEHLRKDPRDLTKKKLTSYPQKYFETVLQNGFLLFFLISYYMECDPTMESPVVQLTKKYKKSVLKVDESNIAEQLFKQSLLGQLLDFSRALLESVVGSLNSVRSLAASKFQVAQDDQDLSPEEREKKKMEKFRVILKDAVNFYLSNSAHIDVAHGDQLEIVYFILLPYTKFLPKEKKVAFHDSVDRSTTQTKVQGLIEEANTLIEVCKHEENLFRIFQKQKLLALFTNYVKLWQEFAFYLTIFLNILILFSFDGTWGDRIHDYTFFNDQRYSYSETKNLVQAIGVGMTCCACFVVAYFLLKNAPLILKRAWNRKGLFEGQEFNIIFWTIDQFYKSFLVLICFLEEIEVMYYIAYGTFAILGTIIHPFFFIFHLSEILFRYPTLKNIILSVYKPRVQLGLAFYLLIVMVYFFTILAYVTIADQYYGNCDVLLYCLLFNIDTMIRGSIGVSVAGFSGFQNVSEKYGIGRFFYDNVSNIALGQIMLNIVAGIIIDTFGSLREEEASKKEDILNYCFICGNESIPFERNQNKSFGGFREHIKLNHYMWNYMFFIGYLRWKDDTDYSGIESYVASKLEEDDLCWIPFNQARELVISEDQGQTEKQKLESMEYRVNNVNQMKIEKIKDQMKEMASLLNFKK